MAGAKKPRLSLHQMLCFSVGHVMNDVINTIFTSYLLAFQTKILGLPNNIVGLLWLLPAGIDSILALFIGHVSDNVSFPFLSRIYGRRKIWHLLGCILVGVCSPFFLMPCFICGEDSNGWRSVPYYVPILVLAYTGWGLTQSNFLALIPVIAKRQSEMVKLGAINSAITLTCGIFVYIVMWALLGSDSSQNLSSSQSKEFMYLVVIAVGTGAFFSAVFHFGTREPTAAEDSSHNGSIHATKFPKDDYGNLESNCVRDSKSLTHAHTMGDVIQGYNDTAIVNLSFIDDERNFKNTDKRIVKSKDLVTLDAKELEAVLWKALAEKNKPENDDSSSIESSGYDTNVEITSEESSDCELVELPMPDTFIDMVPNISELILHSHRSSARSTPFSSPRLSRAATRRHNTGSTVSIEGHHSENLYSAVLKSRLSSTCSPTASPRLCRIMSHRTNAVNTPTATLKSVAQLPFTQDKTTIDINQHNYQVHHNQINPTKGQLEQYQCSFTTDTAEIPGELAHNEERPPRKETENIQRQIAWKTLFKKPEFYKLAGAYMFTRVSQNITTSYLPLFLTDHLKFGKESIAYFPMVILLSGVFASLATKKCHKVLGNKWTFCVGSLLVMGASGWFYLLTPENRSAMYVPAILTGCGSSIMFVTSLALAADFVDSDKKSGAFTIASMTLLCKIVLGVLFCLLQEFSPNSTGTDCPECSSYVRHVFCLTPGVSALFGLISFILFIPATIQCKPIAHTVDAETQTEVIIIPPEEEPQPHIPLEIIMENETDVQKQTIDVEIQTDDQSPHLS